MIQIVTNIYHWHCPHDFWTMESCQNSTGLCRDILVLKVSVGAVAVLCVFIIGSLLWLVRLARKKIRELESLITPLYLTLLDDNNGLTESSKEKEDKDSSANLTTNPLVATEKLSQPNQNEVTNDVTKSRGTRKMCKSDSELSITKKLVLMKLQADFKDKYIYEKCRLPFENYTDWLIYQHLNMTIDVIFDNHNSYVQ